MIVPLIIRGEVIESADVEFSGRRGGLSFRTPQVSRHLEALTSARPSSLAALHQLSTRGIADFLAEVGRRLAPARNPHIQAAIAASELTSGLHPSALRAVYESAPRLFERDAVLELAERSVGIRYLDGWVPEQLGDGRTAHIRAFGARGVHIIAGNIPLIAYLTILRSAVTHSDSLIKLPSNDPLTASAIVRTMIDVDPAHPVTRSFSVAYWKGGDVAVEERLYQPRYIEKIVAWGGLASISHISRYIQPGIDLITLDPKQSMTLVGAEALADDATMNEVARRAACDVAAYNQEMCANARVIYLVCGTDEAGVARAKRFGQKVFEQMLQLPPAITGPTREFSADLKAEVDAIELQDEWYTVYKSGCVENAGAIIVSHLGEPVEFARQLGGRVANIVPVDDVESAIGSVTASTQTVGIYPESLKGVVRDRLALAGAQMLISLGYVARLHPATPQDAIEPTRRMCKWLVDHDCESAVAGPWIQ